MTPVKTAPLHYRDPQGNSACGVRRTKGIRSTTSPAKATCEECVAKIRAAASRVAGEAPLPTPAAPVNGDAEVRLGAETPVSASASAFFPRVLAAKLETTERENEFLRAVLREVSALVEGQGGALAREVMGVVRRAGVG